MMNRQCLFKFSFIFSIANILASSTLPNICLVTDYNNVQTACAKCSNIIVDGITVPAGKQLKLTLLENATLTFKGKIDFEFKTWGGPLMDIRGKRITIIGAPGHRLNGEGQLYWDGIGQQGSTKPTFIYVRTSKRSILKDINVLNCPERCVSVHSSDTTFDRWNIDVSLGDTKGGHNTDGFDIASGTNLVFKNSVIKNQDDCVAVNRGSNMEFSNLECHGSHGLSISVGIGGGNEEDNSVKNIIFSNSKLINADNGIHIKTHPDGGTGLISNVVYKNIGLSGIKKYGIEIEQDYGNKGHLKANIPIRNLTITNVRGTMARNSSGKNVYIACSHGGCAEWHWSGIDISGGTNDCNYHPSGFNC